MNQLEVISEKNYSVLPFTLVMTLRKKTQSLLTLCFIHYVERRRVLVIMESYRDVLSNKMIVNSLSNGKILRMYDEMFIS